GTKHLRLFAIKTNPEDTNLWMAPNLLLQKFPAPEFTATTKVSLFPEEATSGKRAGLIVMGTDYAALSIVYEDQKYYIQHSESINAIDGHQEVVLEKELAKSNQVYFRVQVVGPKGECQFSYSENGRKFKNIGKLRSEERRVGKEWREGWGQDREKKIEEEKRK